MSQLFPPPATFIKSNPDGLVVKDLLQLFPDCAGPMPSSRTRQNPKKQNGAFSRASSVRSFSFYPLSVAFTSHRSFPASRCLFTRNPPHFSKAFADGMSSRLVKPPLFPNDDIKGSLSVQNLPTRPGAVPGLRCRRSSLHRGLCCSGERFFCYFFFNCCFTRQCIFLFYQKPVFIVSMTRSQFRKPGSVACWQFNFVFFCLLLFRALCHFCFISRPFLTASISHRVLCFIAFLTLSFFLALYSHLLP